MAWFAVNGGSLAMMPMLEELVVAGEGITCGMVASNRETLGMEAGTRGILNVEAGVGGT